MFLEENKRKGEKKKKMDQLVDFFFCPVHGIFAPQNAPVLSIIVQFIRTKLYA
jgi:hypothetical protein